MELLLKLNFSQTPKHELKLCYGLNLYVDGNLISPVYLSLHLILQFQLTDYKIRTVSA